jgi:hypothetical protein
LIPLNPTPGSKWTASRHEDELEFVRVLESYGVPTTVPYWELALSMATLIGGFLLTTWLSAKIYRTGILMYGKKVTWKEMIKWAFAKS